MIKRGDMESSHLDIPEQVYRGFGDAINNTINELKVREEWLVYSPRPKVNENDKALGLITAFLRRQNDLFHINQIQYGRYRYTEVEFSDATGRQNLVHLQYRNDNQQLRVIQKTEYRKKMAQLNLGAKEICDADGQYYFQEFSEGLGSTTNQRYLILSFGYYYSAAGGYFLQPVLKPKRDDFHLLSSEEKEKLGHYDLTCACCSLNCVDFSEGKEYNTQAGAGETPRKAPLKKGVNKKKG
jgi:hypothetical protein